MRNWITAGMRREVFLEDCVIGKFDLFSAKTTSLVLVRYDEITHNCNSMPVSQKMNTKGMRQEMHDTYEDRYPGWSGVATSPVITSGTRHLRLGTRQAF